MKRLLILSLLMACAGPAAAQEVLPARDLYEASRLASETMRAFEPAIQLVREQTETLSTLTKAHNQLVIEAPQTSLDKALATIDDFVERREKNGKPLSKEMMRYVRQMRTAVEAAKLGPPPSSLAPLRDQLHHAVIHPLQRLAATNAEQLQTLAQTLARIGDAMGRSPLMETVQAMAAAAEDPK